MVNREKMQAFEEAVQGVLDKGFSRRGLKAKQYMDPQTAVCVYKAEDLEAKDRSKVIFSIHYSEWDREFDTEKADLGPIIAKRLLPETEPVKLSPITVNGEVIAYGVGEKNASRVAQAIYQLRGFFVDDFSEPCVNAGTAIEVEIPKQ